MRGLLLALLAAALLGACGGGGDAGEERDGLGATRGVVLISIDALGAGHLGAYGESRDTSPFFDRLAERGALFERAAVQYPSTLTSHLSIFTGLYPGEHGVYPPADVLPESIPTLPETLREAGFRTAGHTEGGFMGGGFGFARGFEVFSDTPHTAERDIERTFGRGLEWLASVGGEERFFLFLHTYAVHDPYDPPEEFRRLFWDRDPVPGADPTGPELRRLNEAGTPPDAELVRYFEALYSASVRYADAVLEKFFQGLERLGLANQVTVIITSDHGEEFAQHGRLGHAQLYPELLFVPLLVVHPEITGAGQGVRVPTMVESVDLAPTLLELAGVEPPTGVSGRSLMPLLAGARPGGGREAYAELLEDRRFRTLLRQDREGLFQLLASELHADPEGTWIGDRVRFDTAEERLELRVQSFHRERRMRIIEGDRVLAEETVGPAWQSLRIALEPSEGVRRLTLEIDGCDRPADLGPSDDQRCLGVQVAGAPLWRIELYDLSADPGALVDLGPTRADLHRRLARRLAGLDFEPRAEVEEQPLSEETLKTLRALGYVE